MNRKEIENCDWMRRIANQVEDLLVSNPLSRKQFNKHLMDFNFIFKEERERNLEELLPYDDPTGKNYEDPTGGEEDGPKLNSGAKKNYPIKAGYDVKKPEISSYYAALSVLYDCIKGKVAPVLLCRDVLDDTAFSLLLLRLGTDGYDKDDLNSALKWVKKDLDSEFRLIGTGDATPKKQDSDREKARELIQAIESFVAEYERLETKDRKFGPLVNVEDKDVFEQSSLCIKWTSLARASEAAYYLLYRHFDDPDQVNTIMHQYVLKASCEILNSDSHLQREKNAAVLLKAIDRLSLRKLAGDEPAETIPPKSDGTPMDWNRPDHKTQICKWIRTEYSKKGKANKAGVIRAALVHFGLPSEYERRIRTEYDKRNKK